MIRAIVFILISISFGSLFAGSVADKFGPEEPILLNGIDLSGSNTSSKNEPQITLGDVDNDGDLDLVMFEGLENKEYPNGKVGKFWLIRNEGSKDSYLFNQKELYLFVTLSTS